jgi:sulfite reductase beta subunit-like hemoprotein
MLLLGAQQLFAPTENAPTAVTKLLRKLEWAIAHGEHRTAAALAHDLALLQVNCVGDNTLRSTNPVK